MIDLFDCLIDGTMVQQGKPDPEGFLLAAKKLCVSPEHCLVFEDAAKGVEAAIQAGMRTVGIGNSINLKAADTVIQGFNNYSLDTILARL